MISAEAGISPRTFFNYFLYKDAALVPQLPIIAGAAGGQFVNGKGALIDDMATYLEKVLQDVPYDRDTLVQMYQIATSNPRLLAEFHTVFHGFENEMAKLIEARLGAGRREKAEFLALMISAAIRLGFKSWVCEGNGGLGALVGRRIRQMQPLVAEYGGVSPSVELSRT